ncbi:MAG: hypothetical protein ILO42_01565 [Clostridia bacterium]|nr:hypothetical protein [Clostridia bacterium]
MQSNIAVADAGTVCRSYEEAHGVFEVTFQRRGIVGAAVSEAAALDRSVTASRLEYPRAYLYADMMAADRRDRYRTGLDFEGYRYMTRDDLGRLISDGRRISGKSNPAGRALFAISAERSESETVTAVRPAYPYTVCETGRMIGRRETVITPRGETETTVSKIGRGSLTEKLALSLRELLGEARLVKSGITGRQFSGVVAALSLVLVFAIVLVMPIMMSVLIHDEATVVRELEADLAEKEKTAALLQTELESKNDRFMLERLARDVYGMIPLDRSAFTVMKIAPEDSVTLIEEQKSGGAVPALLSALGIRRSGD